MDTNAVIQLVVTALLAATAEGRAALAKEAADKIADLVASSKTTIDDTLVKQAVLPFFEGVATELHARFP